MIKFKQNYSLHISFNEKKYKSSFYFEFIFWNDYFFLNGEPFGEVGRKIKN